MKMFRSKNTVQQHKQKKLRLTNNKSHNTSSKQFQSHHPLSSQTHDNSHNPLPKPFPSVNPSSSQTHDNSHNPLLKQFQSARPSFTLYRQKSSSSSTSSAHSESVPSQPAAFKPSFPPSSSLSDHDQDQDPFDNYEKKLKELVEIIDEHGNILRLERLTTKKVQLLKNGEKVLVPVNHLHQPIKAAGGLCTRFMTLLLKEPNFCPPHTKDWRECKKNHGIRLMGELRRRFCLPQGDEVDNVLINIFAGKFRSVKFNLKRDLFELAAKNLNEANDIGENDEQGRHYSDEELLRGLDLLDAPANFTNEQWDTYKKQLRTPAAKKLSDYGKKARADQIHAHTTGGCSYARKRDEFKVNNKRDANELEFFEIVHKTKDGSYVNELSREFVEQAKQEVSKEVSEASKSGISEHVGPEQQYEIVRHVVDKCMGPGRPILYGGGVKKSQVSKFSFDLRKSRGDSITKENQFLLDKVESQSKQIELQRKQIESQSIQIESQSKQMKIMDQKISECTGELRFFTNALKDMYANPHLTRQETFDTQVSKLNK